MSIQSITSLSSYHAAAVGGGGALCDTAIRPSVRPPVCPSLGYSTLAAWRSCLGYQRCADCGPVRGGT